MSIQVNSMYRPKQGNQLVKEIEGDEFHLSPIQGKILLNDIEEILGKKQGKNLEEIKRRIYCCIMLVKSQNSIIDEMFTILKNLYHTDPRIPDPE